MSFLKSMEWRYTTKKYDASKKIDATLKEEIKKILHLCPSSINSQPWNFTIVSDESTKKELAEASLFNAEKVLNCDAVVVFSRIDSIKAFEKQIQENLPEGAVNYFNTFVKPLPEAEIKAWFDKQVYLSLGVLLAACANMKIDSTPMEGIETDKYNSILKLENYSSLVAVAIGYRDAEDANQIDRKPKSRISIDQIVRTI